MSDDQSGNRIAQPPGMTRGGTSEAEVRQVMANFQTACRAFGPARDYDQTYDVETDLLLEAEAGVFACDVLDSDLIRLQVECFARDQDPDPAVVAMVRLGLAFALTLETGRVPTPVDRYNGALKVMRMARGRGIPPAYDREFVEAQTMLLFGRGIDTETLSARAEALCDFIKEQAVGEDQADALRDQMAAIAEAGGILPTRTPPGSPLGAG